MKFWYERELFSKKKSQQLVWKLCTGGYFFVIFGDWKFGTSGNFFILCSQFGIKPQDSRAWTLLYYICHSEYYWWDLPMIKVLTMATNMWPSSTKPGGSRPHMKNRAWKLIHYGENRLWISWLVPKISNFEIFVTTNFGFFSHFLHFPNRKVLTSLLSPQSSSVCFIKRT